MVKEGRVLAFALFGMLLLLSSDIGMERTLDLIVLFNGNTGVDAVKNTGALVLEQFSIIGGVHVHASELQKSRIERLPAVEGVYPNRILYPLLAQSVPLIGATIAQAQGFTGTGIKVAILDTGINVTDGRISGRVINQSDCTQSSCLNKNPVVNQDSSGHGTQMAIIAAGSSGVATAASILDVKVAQVAGGGGASEADVVKGVEYALNPDGYDSTKDGADIILLSFGVDIGGVSCAGPASAAIDNAVSRGVSVIVANGDTGCINGTMYPACSRKVIAVGATTDATGTAALSCPVGCVGGTSSPDLDSWFCGSSRGVDKWEGKIKPDMVAPGYTIDIGSPQYGTTDSAYSIQHSSSIAAAHVAGAAAILMQKVKANWGVLKDPNPDTSGVNSSTAALKAILLNSAKELGDAGRDEKYGAGRLNVSEGVRQANSTYVQYCNRWYSGEISSSVRLYHNISVPSGAANLSVTLYWEENNKTTHKNLDLVLKDPSLSPYGENSPINDVVRQVRVGSPTNGIWYAIVEDVNQLASKYVLVSNYPVGDCQPPTLTTVTITTYNGTVGQAHAARNDFFPSNHYDWLEEYTYGTQVVQYAVTMYDQFGQLFEHNPGTTVSISYQNGSSNGEVNFAPATPTGTGTYSTLVSNTNYISLPPNAGATYTGIDWPQHRWYINALVSGCGFGCPKSASQKEVYVNKTYGQSLGIGGATSTRYDTPAQISVNVSNLGNVGDRYTLRAGNNFTANTAGIETSGRCSFNLVTNPVSADYLGGGSTTIEVAPDSTLTGGDYCWMDYVNATSENALFLVKNTSRDNGWAVKVENFASPLCDGLPLNFSGGYKYVYFTYTPTEGDVYVKDTDLAIRAYPDTVNWSKGDGIANFSLYYAKDDNGDFVPNTGEAYALVFTRKSSGPDSLQQIEVNSSSNPALIGQLMRFNQLNMGYKRFLLRNGQRYSFKIEALDGDLFQLAVNARIGENATGGCSGNVLDNNSLPPSGCLCTVGSAFAGGSVIARFFGHEARYGFSQVAGVGLYINDTISFLEDINYKSQVCEGELDADSYCRPKFGSMPIYRNSTKLYFRASPKTHNLPNDMVQASNIVKSAAVAVRLYDSNGILVNAAPYSVPCSTIPCKSTSTITFPRYNSLSQIAKVGIWTANFSASATYFTPASQATTFTVKGISNISMTNSQNKYYRGTNYNFNSTVRNEFNDIEDASIYGVVWELYNGTGTKTMNSSQNFRYLFSEAVGPVNISATASGTYLDSSSAQISAEVWDRLNSSNTIVPDPDYQLGSWLNFSINVTRSFGEPASSGISVNCNITSANLGNGTNLTASFSGGLWACRQYLDREKTSIGASQVRVYHAGDYYEPTMNAQSFTVLGANFSVAVASATSAYMGTNFNFSLNITNRGNVHSSNAHFSLLLPAELVRASGNWSERDLNDSEALGHNLQAGESFAYAWVVNASNILGNYTVNFSVAADNAPSVRIISPLEIKSTMDFSVQNPIFANATVPATLTVNLTNLGDFNILGANISVILPADVQLTGGNWSYLFNLNVSAKRSLSWEVASDLGMNFTAVFNVTSANAGAFLRNSTLVVSNNLKAAILSPNSTVRSNVSDYGNFTATLNITHNRSIVSDLFVQNFSAQIGSYPAAVFNATFQNGLWAVNITSPWLNESLNYDLRITVVYYNQSINRRYNITSVSYGSVHAKETVPLILNWSLQASFSVGNQSRINVSVYDKSELAYLSGTFYDMDGNVREYNFSKVSASGYYKNYTYNFTPIVEGDYNLTLTAMDWFGTNSTNSTNFTVYGPPRIKNIFFPASRYLVLGENVSMVVNATSHVSPVSVFVNISNSTSTITYNTTQIASGYNLTQNFTGLGTYPVLALANDTYGTTVSYADSFTISGQIRVYLGLNLTGTTSFTPADTADPRISLTAETYADIPAGVYDIYARTSDGNLTVKLSSVDLTLADATKRTIKITPVGITSSVFSPYTTYDIGTNFTYPSILLGFKYPSEYNASRVYVYKCSAPVWNGTACNGTWSKLSTSVDAQASTAYSTVSSLSGFVVGQEHMLTNKITGITPSIGVTPGSSVSISFNVSLDGNPQASLITPRVWFDSVELNVSGHTANGYEHSLSVAAPGVTALKRNVVLEAKYQEAEAVDYITATDTVSEGVTYYIPASCGDGLCNGNETCGSCSSDCGGCTGAGGGSGAYTSPILSENYTTPQPALFILEYPASVSLAPGGSDSKKVSVKNIGNVPLNVSIKFDELALWITAPGSRLIALNASAEFDIYYTLPEFAVGGIYPYQIKAVANNYYNATLAVKSSQLNITATSSANTTPPQNGTPYVPPTPEGRYTELKDMHQRTKNDLTKIGLLGYNVSALERELDKANSLLVEAGGNVSASKEKLDLAEAKIASVREDAKNLVSEKYAIASKEKPEYANELSQAQAALDAGDFGKAAYLLKDIETKTTAGVVPKGTSIVYSLLLIAVLLAIGGAGYYNKEGIQLKLEDLTRAALPLQIEDVRSKSNALLGKRVAIKGTVVASGGRTGGFWLKVKDRTGEMLVWNKTDMNLGELISVRGIVAYDKSIDTLYVEARMLKGSGA